jgi:cell division protein ZapA (FtsZ GTPase activity inhibitor)
MADLIPVNVIIGDRTYRLRIEPEDEEILRKMVKIINDKIVEFKTNFAGKDMQDFVAMVLIWMSTDQSKQATDHHAIQQTSEKLHTLEQMLDKALEDCND